MLNKADECNPQRKKKVTHERTMDCPGIFNWHSKHNTKYSVLWKQKRGLPNGTQMKKCKNTPFGRPCKGKVLLWKADKVMVRLSIVKIEVWPFKTLFIYSYILSLWFQWGAVTVQAGYCGASLIGRVVETASSALPGMNCRMILKVRLIFWDTEWQAVKSKNDTSKLGSEGILSENRTAHLIYTFRLTGVAHTQFMKCFR